MPVFLPFIFAVKQRAACSLKCLIPTRNLLAPSAAALRPDASVGTCLKGVTMQTWSRATTPPPSSPCGPARLLTLRQRNRPPPPLRRAVSPTINCRRIQASSSAPLPAMVVPLRRPRGA